MSSKFRVRKATPSHLEALRALLPRLGDFPRPPHRTQEEIYRPDAKRLEQWAEGGEPSTTIFVAENDRAELLGFAILTAGSDPLNGAPSAHLEALAVASGAEGAGVGSALLGEAESAARDAGALTITLHVFQTNIRAMELYERKGYRAEWIRYRKPLRDTRTT